MKKNDSNFDLIRQVLLNNPEIRSQYISALFSDVLEEHFFPRLKKEQMDLNVFFSQSVICLAIVEALKKDFSKSFSQDVSSLKIVCKKGLSTITIDLTEKER